MWKKRPRLLSLPLLLLLLLVSVSVGAQGPITDDEVNEVAKDLYCPICENTPLDVCPTQACEDWRDEIRGYLAEGLTKEEINQAFANQYGDRVLAEPPTTGFSLWLWVLPVLVVVIGGLFFARYLRSLRVEESVIAAAAPAPAAPRPPKPTAAAGSELDNFVARIEAELQED